MMSQAAWLFVMMMLTTHGSVYKSLIEHELEHYTNGNRILHEILLEEKCIPPKARAARALVHDDVVTSTQLQIEIRYYQELIDLLVACRERSTSKPSPTTTTTPATTTTSTTTTTEATTILSTGVKVNLALGKKKLYNESNSP